MQSSFLDLLNIQLNDPVINNDVRSMLYAEQHAQLV